MNTGLARILTYASLLGILIYNALTAVLAGEALGSSAPIDVGASFLPAIHLFVCMIFEPIDDMQYSYSVGILVTALGGVSALAAVQPPSVTLVLLSGDCVMIIVVITGFFTKRRVVFFVGVLGHAEKRPHSPWVVCSWWLLF